MDGSMHADTSAHDDERLETADDDEREDTRGERLRALGVGLLLGAAIGAGAALLMAPQSGNDTRKQLRRGARRLASRSSSAVSDWWDDTDREARRLLRRKMRRGRKVLEGWRG
jgi:gas vesicle protein